MDQRSYKSFFWVAKLSKKKKSWFNNLETKESSYVRSNNITQEHDQINTQLESSTNSEVRQVHVRISLLTICH